MNARSKLPFLLILVGLILAGCGDQAAIDRAKAQRIEQQSQEEAAARQAAQAREQAEWESTKRATDRAKQILLPLGAVALVLALLAGLAVVVYRFWQMSQSLESAFDTYVKKRAELAAGTIKLDRETRTFPALVADNAIHNLETAEVYLLTEPKPADPQQVTTSGQIRALGIKAQVVERVGKAAKDAQATHALPLISAPRRGQTRQDAIIVVQDQDEPVEL